MYRFLPDKWLNPRPESGLGCLIRAEARLFKDSTWKPRPESGPDCLIWAIFAQHRYVRKHEATLGTMRANDTSQKWSRPGMPPGSGGILRVCPLLGVASCPYAVSNVRSSQPGSWAPPSESWTPAWRWTLAPAPRPARIWGNSHQSTNCLLLLIQHLVDGFMGELTF